MATLHARCRQVAHALLVILAALPWLVGVVGFGVALLLVIAADRVMPGATRGNCWSFVGPRWHRHGGYIVVRMAEGVTLFGRRVIPHAMWLPDWPADLRVHQTKPEVRSRNPLRTVYFKFRMLTVESPRNATGGPHDL